MGTCKMIKGRYAVLMEYGLMAAAAFGLLYVFFAMTR
jgi:hypothetical protein